MHTFCILAIPWEHPQEASRGLPEGRFAAFQAPGRKVVPGSIQRVVLEHFRCQPAKWSQEVSRGSFWSISAPARKVVPGSLQRVVVEHFRRQAAKSSQEASRGSFWSISIRIANPCSVVHFIDAHAYILKAFRLQLPHLKMHTFCILAISWKHTSYSYPK
jgi:hypothetical protein